MKLLLCILVLTIMAVANAEELAVTILASLDAERIAATGMKTEEKKDMPDFTITYLLGPESTDSIGIFEGGHPTPFSTRGKQLGKVKDSIAGQAVVWACWSQEEEGKTRYGAEAFLQSRRTVVMLGEKKEEFVDQFHVFIIRGDLKALAEARKLAASIIKKGPIPSTINNDGTAPSSRLKAIDRRR